MKNRLIKKFIFLIFLLSAFNFLSFASCGDGFNASVNLTAYLVKIKSLTSTHGSFRENNDNLLRDIVYIQNGDFISTRPPKGADAIAISQKILFAHLTLNEMVNSLKLQSPPKFSEFMADVLIASQNLLEVHLHLLSRVPHLSLEELRRPLGRHSEKTVYDLLADHSAQLNLLSNLLHNLSQR